MPVRKKRRPLEIGTVFVKEWKGQKHKMEVVGAPWGIGYKVGRIIYRTPSGAAKSIVNYEVNGWRFWRIGD
jgi:hypothetical protein